MNRHKKDVIKRYIIKRLGEKERNWNKQPAQDDEHPLGLPDNSEEHPSFNVYPLYNFSRSHMPDRGMTSPETEHTLRYSVSKGPLSMKHSPSRLLSQLPLL